MLYPVQKIGIGKFIVRKACLCRDDKTENSIFERVTKLHLAKKVQNMNRYI